MDSPTAFKLGVIIVVIVVILIVWFAVPCEKYSSSNTAQFTVNRPKYNPPNFNVPKSFMNQNMSNTTVDQKENFMLYPDQLKLVSDRTKMLGGSLITSSNNPFMGALPNEAKFGVTAPQRQGPVTVSLSNSGNEAKALWSTVI